MLVHTRNLVVVALLTLLAFAAFAAPPLTTADSGWYTAGVNAQCNVAIDAVDAGSYCNHRLSVMCVQLGAAGISGIASTNAQFELPVAMPLFTPPSTTPTGSITITALGSSPQISVNGAAGYWTRVVAYNGTNGCEIEAPAPTPSPHYPRLCREFGYFCGG